MYKFDFCSRRILNKNTSEKKEKRTNSELEMDNIYKVLGEMMGDGNGLSDDVKKGILVGIELMGYQAEKWLDNEEHALSFRNNTKLGDGWSGWKETYDHVAGFMYSQQPDEEQMKNCKLETYELEEGEVEEDEVDRDSIDEWTTWLKSDAYKKSDNFPYTNHPATNGGPQNPLKSAEEMKEEIMIEKNDSEDMELSEEEDDSVTVVSFTTDDEYYDSADEECDYGTDEGSELDDWEEFQEITYENVKYILNEDGKTVGYCSEPGEKGYRLFDDDIGIMKKEEKVIHTKLHKKKREFTVIEFDTHDEFEDHMARVRESILPEDGEEVKDILVDFILRNYPNFRYCEEHNWIEFRGKKNGDYHKGFCIETTSSPNTGVLTTLPSLRDYSEYQIKTSCVEELPLEDLNEELGWTIQFPPAWQVTREQGDRFFMYNPKGKKMGDVMKEIEKVYRA